MNHNIMITVDGYSWVAVATTHHTSKQREVSSVACADVPTTVLGALDEHVINIHDVLELVRVHLNDTAINRRTLNIGPIKISWYPLDSDALRADITGRTFAVKITDSNGQAHVFEVGASNSWCALDLCMPSVPGPVRSSIVQPITF